MPIDATNFIRLNMTNAAYAADIFVSLHTAHPGDRLSNEVDYVGYIRPRLNNGGYTEFAPFSGNKRTRITHAALSTVDTGVMDTLSVVELGPGMRLEPCVCFVLLLMFTVDAPFSGIDRSVYPTPLLPQLQKTEPATSMVSRFAALAAELEDD